MTEVLTLIQLTHGVDDYGDPTTTESRRDVFGQLQSIGQTEFYQAQSVGLKPEVKFVLADYFDFEDETLAEYNGQRYHILRTYRKGQALELTLYKEVNPVERS